MQGQRCWMIRDAKEGSLRVYVESLQCNQETLDERIISDKGGGWLSDHFVSSSWPHYSNAMFIAVHVGAGMYLLIPLSLFPTHVADRLVVIGTCQGICHEPKNHVIEPCWRGKSTPVFEGREGGNGSWGIL